jgi:uncharacterized spore protein YtfJ
MENLNDMLEKITEFIKSEAKTETIIGKEFKLGEFACVPVMSIGMGLGGGRGEAKGTIKSSAQGDNTGTGGAAGIGMGPVGFLVSKGSEIQFISATSHKGLSSIFEKIPDLIEKYMSKKAATEKA